MALEPCRYAGTTLLDDAYDLVARSKRQRPFEVRITAAPNHGIGKACAGGEDLNANLSGPWIGDGQIFRNLQGFGTAKPRDAKVLPRHLPSIGARSVCVEPYAN